MTYRISGIFFLILLIVVVVLWQQGMRLYPYTSNGGNLEAIIQSPKRLIDIDSARKLKILKLDFSLFESPIYKSLQFRDVPVSEISLILRGRVNPFSEISQPAPVGVVAVPLSR
ncbi:MAG: hypothetical protein AAB362_03100 [Patescibacteria group bacterium]